MSEDQKALTQLKQQFHDQAIWIEAQHAAGKMFPNLLTIARMNVRMSKLCSILERMA